MQYVIDIETNGLLKDLLTYKEFPYVLNDSAKLWCVVITNVETKEYVYAVKEDITKEWIKESLKDCTILIAHNGIKFDYPVLQLFGVFDYTIGYIDGIDTLFGKEIKFVDTLIYSRLFNPDRLGGHSLDAWGDRVGNKKINYRQLLIDKGLLDKSAEKGHEFTFYVEDMLEYCVQDTFSNVDTYLVLLKELEKYPKWKFAIQVENKLADIAIKRETLGFKFNKKLAIENLKFLTTKMNSLTEEVNKHLPKRSRNKGEIKEFTPPKIQVNKNGSISAVMQKFIDKIEANYFTMNEEHYITYNENTYKLPYHEPLVKDIVTTIDNLDAIKMYLISLGWNPTLWKERDLTKDAKKQNISYKKRVEALERWFNETINGKYKKERLEIIGYKEEDVLDIFKEKLREDKPVRVPTSPNVRVGVDKELCPNLTKLGDKVSFANDFVLYLTYKHRKNSIAGGAIEDMDFDEDIPNTGYLANYREEDGRIGTPAIEIGAACVIGTTRLLTWNGYKKITDVVIGDKVLTHKGTYNEVTDCIDNGVKPTYKVILDNGMELVCTSNHPFYTTKGWVICEELIYDEVYTYNIEEDIDFHNILNNDKDTYDILYKHINLFTQFKTAKVFSVNYVGEQQTYDITVKDAHSYVAEGIVTHNTNRYKHITVANIPRASSIFGKEMRSLFGCGENAYQLGFDFASLEARIQGHYIMPYEGGKELADTLLAEKPNDVHSVTAKQLGISRNDAKSVNYAILYGASPNKLAKMLNLNRKESVDMYNKYWDSKPSMKQLKDKVESFWNNSNRVYVPSIDGRKIFIRSQHSLLNALFQSAGVICAKYVTVFMYEEFEKLGYCIDVFKGKPDVASMIEYHDEIQLYVNPELIENVYFDSEKEAKTYLSSIVQDNQYSAISYDEDNDKYYITIPNIISKTIQKAITMTEERLKLKVNLGYEWIVNKNWYGCH